MPTTPFLLLSAWCFAKSSQRFHNWFISTRLYKNHLDSFVRERSMTLKTKISLLAFASSMLLLAMYFMNSIWLRLF
ncbi:YbaN family protein, partial [Desulfovibrio desulfuricans]|uniref:YbaN family protein n=1 Tax=Desulfovibrio desulfuricans TaxID=876 RepID=UPI001D05DC1F|nr:YbaN family protein [Desulfovibrio desulfuricans]